MGLLLLMSKRDTGNPLILPGAVGAWDMVTLADSGQTVVDISGNGNHLTLGSTSGVDTNDPTNQGNGFSFSTDDFMRATLPAMNLTGDLSAVIVLKTASAVLQYPINVYGATPFPGWGLRLNASGVAGFWSGAKGVWVEGSVAYNDNAYHTLGVSVISGQVSFYKDGVFDRSQASLAPNSSTAPTTVGADSNGASPFNGNLAFIEVLNRGMPASEHASFHNTLKSSLASRAGGGIVLP